MNKYNLEIRIHTQFGAVQTFFQDNPAVTAKLLKTLHPARMFSDDLLTIAGEYSLTVFDASKISRVDFLTEEIVPWKYPSDISDVIELSEEQFRERSHLNDPARLERRRSPKQAGESAAVFADVEMTGGMRIFLSARIKVGLPTERPQRLRALFSAPAVHFRNPAGGTSVLNLKNLVRFTLNPGPDVTPSDAWPAHHLTQYGSGRPAYVLE